MPRSAAEVVFSNLKKNSANLKKTIKSLESKVEKLESEQSGIFDPESPIVRSQAIILLTKGNRANRYKSSDQIADKLGATSDQVTELLSSLKVAGYNVVQRGLKFAIEGEFLPGPKVKIKIDMKGGKEYYFGVVSDPHMCSHYQRPDILETAYDLFKAEGITEVYAPGNLIDGECRFNRFELLAHGVADQVAYLVDHFPQRDGIKTRFVAADDHEGWWTQQIGLDIGKYIELFAKDMGRTDLEYIGYLESDIALQAARGKAIMRVVHPGGGTPYAISYPLQKTVESYQGGEKPRILVCGHFHKAGYFYPREIHCLLSGCTQDQTRFMRKKKLAAHVCFWTVKVRLASDGSVAMFSPTMYPFYDKEFYEEKGWFSRIWEGK